jgi:hypothetical protein
MPAPGVELSAASVRLGGDVGEIPFPFDGEYHEHLVKRIDPFKRSVERSELPGEVMRKLLSILDCLEYQIELGTCPASVIRSLQAAMCAWLEEAGDQAPLEGKLDACIEAILSDTEGGRSPGAG